MNAPRVLHVVATSGRRGGEVFASDLIRTLADLGADQRVALLRDSHPAQVEFDAPTVSLGEGVRRMPGLRIDPATLRSLRRSTEHFRPDVVQAHGGEPLKYGVLALGRSGPPLVYRRIGMAPAWVRRGVRRAAHGSLMRRADLIVAVADAVLRETVDLFGVSSRRIVTIPNGIDLSRMDPARSRRETRLALGIRDDAIVLLSVGSLTWEKDPLGLLEILEPVLRGAPRVRLVLAGDGSLRGEVARWIEAHGLIDRVHPIGSRSDVPDLMGASDVFVFASRPDGMEGMPGVLIEAGAVGLPVVAYRVAGVAEVVEHGRTGMVAEWGDRETMRDHVVRLIRDGSVRRELGDRAARHCRGAFDIRAVAEEYLRVYVDVAVAAVPARPARETPWPEGTP